MTKHRYVLGTGLSHDGSACLLKDGEILVAIEKERLTRRKHDGGNDVLAMQYCLETAGIGFDDLQLVVQNANFGMLKFGNGWYRGARPLPQSVPVVTISHHLAHAYGAFGCSPFDEADVLVIDGCGNAFDECVDSAPRTLEHPHPDIQHLYFEKDSFYTAGPSGVVPVVKDFSPWGFSHRIYPMHPNTTQHSIGGLYLAVSMYVFAGFEDPGKLMGLAPYGRPGVYTMPMFDLTDGRVFVRHDWMSEFTRPARTRDDLNRHFQYYADIAYWTQREIERAILYIVQSRREAGGSHNLCYSGGVALNAVANQRIVKESGYDEVFIQPAAADNGLAVGCAFYGWLNVLGESRRRHAGSTCFGRSYDVEDCAEAVPPPERAAAVDVKRRSDYIEEAARLLEQGRVVGWYQGRSEFGPRALGNRSILADPRRPEVRDYINRAIKRREDFRPFAPSVLADEVSTYFEWTTPSPYMLLVAPVRQEWRTQLPAVVHEDGTARIQTVTEEMNPAYYALLQAFKRLSGIGLLLNTSLNRRGMPIVETPEEAVDFFMTSGLHALVLGPFVICSEPSERAKRQPRVDPREIAEELARRFEPRGSSQSLVQINARHAVSWTVNCGSGDVTPVTDAARPAAATVDVDLDDLLTIMNSGQRVVETLLNSRRVECSGDENLARNVVKALARVRSHSSAS